MPTVSLQYEFRQPFRVSAARAFAWCTDFGPEDAPLLVNTLSRTVRPITADALILTDRARRTGRSTRIQRLVRVLPSRYSWTNTHLTGPYRHSQYWYRIVPDGPNRSHLHFTGFRLLTTPRTLSKTVVAKLTRAERAHDAGTWRRSIAPALERDVRRTHRP